LPAPAGDAPHALLLTEVRPELDNPLAAGENLLQAQRWEVMGRLAGGVVHDFNNLLTGVMLYTDLLLSSIDPRDRRRRYAQEIRSAIVQASALVRQLLVFARPQKLQSRALSLNQIAEDMKDLLSRLIGENIALDFKLDPDLGLLQIDQAQAQQIILNLVLNARDAMPEGGRIVVETSNCSFQGLARSTVAQSAAKAFPCILFTVSDNGCGMDAKTRQRLFEPFFTTKNAGNGTGLGLTTVRTIVTANRGLIHVESEPRRGTRVMILFPRAAQTADAVFLPSQDAFSHPSSNPFQVSQKESVL
jgi:signal transduction histidine kinase